MKNRWLLAALVLLITVTITGCYKEEPERKDELKAAQASTISRQELSQIISTEPANAPQVEGQIISGVLPHHLLAAPLITEFLSALATQKPKLIVLIGPNHDNEGGQVITGLNDWQTPEGRMVTEEKAVQALLESGLAVRDEKVLATEHSITALVPLINHYMPEARVVPIIVQPGITIKDVDAILLKLKPFLKHDAVILASVDFSHYLTRSQAQAKDRMTLGYMQKFDYITLFHLSSDYLDSPAALTGAFRWAEGQGVKQFQVLHNTNSGIIMGNDSIPTTSYFTLVFVKK